MVCEGPPRLRSLFVSRRGQFFEDPFFRDAWPDYSHAVRRIVDRFNDGWVSSRSRIHDSQYHSMYRTLRTARLNYATHSARFKEDGNKYKLVMDVHEFIGGDITVRTAGSTVSVRGKLEADAPPGSKPTSLCTKGEKEDDASSVSSGLSASSRTLHRRFTLPADADCKKVESSLSKDAVLTVSIPKRTDVRYIPVTIEGEGSAQINSERSELNTSRLGGVKRSSDSTPESNRKKPQEEAPGNKHFSSYRRANEDEDLKRGAETSRRRSRYDDFYDRKTDSLNKFTNGSDPRKRTYDEAKGSSHIPESADDRGGERSRRRRDKYEQVHEINIPVEINRKDNSDRVFRPRSLAAEPKVHLIEIQRERPKSSIEMPSQDERLEKRIRKSSGSSHESDSPEPIEEQGAKEKEKTSPPSPKFPSGLGADRNKGKSISLDRILNDRSYEPRHSEGCQGKKSHEEDKENSVPDFTNNDGRNDRKSFLGTVKNFGTSQYKPIDLDSIYKVSDERHKESLMRGAKYSRPDYLLMDQKEESSSASSSDDINEDTRTACDSHPNTPPNLRETGTQGHTRTQTEIRKENPAQEQSLINNLNEGRRGKVAESPPNVPQQKPQAKNSLTVDTAEVDQVGKSPPPSPGGQEVKVEKGQTCLEEDIFRDCWSDFSNTLQEVLNRLQELSSELGQSKLLATTPEDPNKTDIAVTSTKETQIKGNPSENALDGIKHNVRDSSTGKAAHSEPKEIQICSLEPTTSTESLCSVDEIDKKQIKSKSGPASSGGISPCGDPEIDSLGRRNLENGRFVTSDGPIAPNLASFVATPPQEASSPLCVGRNTARLNQERPLYMPNNDRNSKESPKNSDIISNHTFGAKGSERHSVHPSPLDKLHPSTKDHPLHSSNAEFLRGTARIQRPTSLLLGKDPLQGSLLPQLRKNSPVEALQERFLNRSCNGSPSSSYRGGAACDVQYLPVELEDLNHGRRDRSAPSKGSDPTRSRDKPELSPGASLQSPASPGPKSTRHEDPPCTLNDQTGGAISDQDLPIKGVKVEFPEESERVSFCSSPESVSEIVSVCEDDLNDVFSSHKNSEKLSDNKSSVRCSKSEIKGGILNNLSLSKEVYPNISETPENYKQFSYQPNIGSLESPESNLINENSVKSECNIVKGKLSFPFSSFGHQIPTSVTKTTDPRISEEIKKETPSEIVHPHAKTDCVIECNNDVGDLKIPGDDVMGGEHLSQTRVGRPRVNASPPLSPAKVESCRFSPQNKKQCPSSFSHQERGNAEHFRPLRREMGGVFTRSNKPDDFAKPPESPPSSPCLKSPPGGSQHYPYRTAARSRERSSTDPPLPSYVRQRSEPSRRHSGFSHVTSDNVKKMRDVWGPKKERIPEAQQQYTPPPQSPRLPSQVPPVSPMRQTPSRRISDISSDAQQWRKSSPLPTSYPSTQTPVTSERKNGHRKRSPSPSPVSGRVSSVSPSRPRNSSSSATRTPLQDYQRKANPASYSNKSQNPLLNQKNLKSRSPSPLRTRQGKSPSPEKRRFAPSSTPVKGKQAEAFKENISSPSPCNRRRNKETGRVSTERSSSNARPDSMPSRFDQRVPSSANFKPREGSPLADKNKSSPKGFSAPKAHQKIFKRFRNANLQPDSEAICFKEEEDKYKMVLDVEEYVPGEIEVLQDDKVLTVKGRVETKDSGDHTSIRTFNRTFNIPRNSKEEDVDSALSEDGILTIFVPKKKERIIKIELVD